MMSAVQQDAAPYLPSHLAARLQGSGDLFSSRCHCLCGGLQGVGGAVHCECAGPLGGCDERSQCRPVNLTLADFVPNHINKDIGQTRIALPPCMENHSASSADRDLTPHKASTGIMLQAFPITDEADLAPALAPCAAAKATQMPYDPAPKPIVLQDIQACTA